VSNVLSDDKKKQVIALGQLGWPLRRIEKATGVRRETATGYLRAAGVPVRPPGGWGKLPPAKPANNPTTDSGPESKPANEVTTDFGGGSAVAGDARQTPGPSSDCDPYREVIELGLSRGRNAMAVWRTWWISTVSPAAIKASNASSASCAESGRRKRGR
jgi:hypothetical protein